MYGSDDNNGQQPGDNTPPPMMDAPMNGGGSDAPVDPPAANNDAPFATDTGAGNYLTNDTSSGMTVPDGMMPRISGDDVKAELEKSDDPASQNLAAKFPQNSPSDSAVSSGSSDDLLELKQQALQQLAPLVNHLEQSPEDEFRTTMMMIQASDNKDLLPKAYQAAQKITDDKEKAQALLDVVNEINYFTQQPTQDK